VGRRVRPLIGAGTELPGGGAMAPADEEGGDGAEAPALSEEQAAALSTIHGAVRACRARQRVRARRAEHEADLRRVPNSDWSFDRLRNVLVCSCNTEPAPRMIAPSIVFSIDNEVADCVVSEYVGERDPETGLFAGQGKATFVTGQAYDGQWANGLMHGTGVFTWTSGVVYKGPVVKGHLTGKAVLRWPGGNVYFDPRCERFVFAMASFPAINCLGELLAEDGHDLFIGCKQWWP